MSSTTSQTCKHCNVIIVDNGAGDWVHGDSLDTRCAANQTVDPTQRKHAAPKDLPPKLKKPELLGCPQCGGENLSLAMLVYESVRFYTDGNYECEGIDDYGDTVAILCLDCTWSMGDTTHSSIDPSQFLKAHQDAIRAEILKEMANDD